MKIQEFLKEEIDNPTDSVKMDIPLVIRMLEYAREDAQTDLELHKVAERMIALSEGGRTLTIDDYNQICGIDELVSEDASGGGTSSGAVATSMGGGAGFGKSIFMSRTNPKTKKSKR